VYKCAGNSKARVDKVPPKMLDYFGWCTWDAFYSTISAEGDHCVEEDVQNPKPSTAL